MRPRKSQEALRLSFGPFGDRNAPLAGVRREGDARPMMDSDRAKRFLGVFTAGKQLNTLTIRELYLSGYIGIELNPPGKKPLPTVITEKGKRVLEPK